MGLFYLTPLKLIIHIQPWETETVELVDQNNDHHKLEFKLKTW
jgi:hypothetical protein